LTAEDSPEPDILLEEGVPVAFDGDELDVLHTPGHTPGGICLRRGAQMIVGDTLFRGSVGRTDLPGGDWDTLVRSIRSKLFALPDDVHCYPGHEDETTIGRERRTNPFVGDAALRAAR
jgi:glyoxylase-like metal-dependent hydrolase (beta-lactamase superfamily II)